LLEFIILLPATYLVGSVNFSILLLRALAIGDPRSRFSGNPGTTNVYRLAGFWWAGVVLVLDLARAAGVAWAAISLLPSQLVPWVAVALFLGNRYPLWHGFAGGKGVAGLLGFTGVVYPPAAGLAAAAWVALFAIVRVPFVASMLMVGVLAAGLLVRTGLSIPAVTGTVAAAGSIFWAHRKNIRELRARNSERSV